MQSWGYVPCQESRKAICLPENKGGHQRQQETSVVVITLSQMSNPHRELRGRERAGTGAMHAAHISRALFKTRHTVQESTCRRKARTRTEHRKQQVLNRARPNITACHMHTDAHGRIAPALATLVLKDT